MGQSCNTQNKKGIYYMETPITSGSKEIQNNTISKGYLAHCPKEL
jgi:hypothetical protein